MLISFIFVFGVSPVVKIAKILCLYNQLGAVTTILTVPLRIINLVLVFRMAISFYFAAITGVFYGQAIFIQHDMFNIMKQEVC